MKWNNVIPAALAVALIAGGSCQRKEVSRQEIEADELYHKSVRATRAYLDSLSFAKDSATVLRLERNLEENVTKLNYAYRPETYLAISQGQNDTLSNLTLRFAHLRDSLLYSFAHPAPAPGDTTAAVPSATPEEAAKP